MQTLQNKLIHWFEKNARPLPWRKKYKPYEVWISEVMLQQTQVDTALPYYRRWLKTFPTIASLAKSNEKKVLKNWEGLGYYSRARNLHQSAKIIQSRFGGVFPRDFESILSLKGIGRYSAGAISSIAFNQDQPIVDGNILRVLSRIFLINKSVDSEKNKEIFWETQEKLIPKGRARYFNQALMELGALICTKNNPSCAICPVQTFCKAYKSDAAENYPIRNKRRPVEKIEAAALVINQNDTFLVRKRPAGKIMGGLWEFPEWKFARNTKLSLRLLYSKTIKAAAEEFNIELSSLKYLGPIKRSYTYFNENLHVFLANATDHKIKTRSSWPHRWLSKKEFSQYPFSSAHAKVAKLIESQATVSR